MLSAFDCMVSEMKCLYLLERQFVVLIASCSQPALKVQSFFHCLNRKKLKESVQKGWIRPGKRQAINFFTRVRGGMNA